MQKKKKKGCAKSVQIPNFSGLPFPAFRLNTEDLLIKSLYSVRMWENTDEKISEFARFSRSECVNLFALFQRFTLAGSNSGVLR